MRKINPEKVEERKKQILEAARQCFENRGFHSTSMAEICARAQISPGALYRYFASKEEIIFSMCDEERYVAINEISELIEKAKQEKDIIKPLLMLLDSGIEEYCKIESAILNSELMAEAARNKPFAAKIKENYDEYKNCLTELFKYGQEIGQIKKGIDAYEAASLVIASFDGLILQMILEKDLSPEKIHNWIKNFTIRYLFVAESAQALDIKQD